ncbi:MAG: hypothetical protein MR802_10335 [Prevotella sp.]|nr:hypothetical protein [Prevotella sp.]
MEKSVIASLLFHPVKSYLDSLPEWDGHDHIADLLRMSEAQHPQTRL